MFPHGENAKARTGPSCFDTPLTRVDWEGSTGEVAAGSSGFDAIDVNREEGMRETITPSTGQMQKPIVEYPSAGQYDTLRFPPTRHGVEFPRVRRVP